MKQLAKKARILTTALVIALIIALLPLGALAESYSAVVTKKSVKVYADPALSDYAGSLKRGAVVVVEEVNGATAMISYKGVSGYYCSISALTDVLEVGKPVIVNTTCYAYEKPSTSSDSIKVKKGTELTLLAVDSTWALVEGNGYGVYILKSNLSLVDEELSTPTPKPTAAPDLSGSIECTVTASTLNVYEATSTSSARLTVLEYGDEVQVIAYNSNWAYLHYEGIYGYAATSGLIKTSLLPTDAPTAAPETEESFEAVVVVKSQAYAKASTSSRKLSVLPVGTVVTVLSYNSTWARVEKNGAIGYVKTSTLVRAEDYEEPDNEPTVKPDDELESVSSFSAIVLSKTQAYSSADASSAKVAVLAAGTIVKVHAYNSSWAQVEYEGSICYVKTSSLDRYELSSCTAFTAVVVTRVQAYAAPSTSASKMSMLSKGTEVKVLAYDSEWAMVEKGGAVGYVRTYAIERKAAVNLAEEYRDKYPNVQFTATVIADSVPGYYDADTSSSDFTLSIGTTVDVYGYSKNWAYIGIGSSRGFIATKYLSAADYTELSAGSSGENTKKLQKTLMVMGYYDGEADGSYSNLTTTAVRRFQAAAGLDVTGNADVATLRVLYGGYAPACPLLSASLTKGNTGDNVTRVQTRLYYLDYFSKSTSVDGDYGSTTVAAVKLFQGAAGLNVTGVIDSATMKALYAANAPSLPSGSKAVDYVASSSSGSSSAVLTVPKGYESTQSYLPANPTKDEKIEYVIYLAQQQLGKPYIYGTAGPNSFDCSGLTVYCYKKVGVSLGRSAYAHGYNSSTGAKIGSMSDLKRGDIVCFDTISDSDVSDHVGIYLGGGYFIHASSGSGNGRQVCVSNLNSGYYTRVFSWGRRPIE